MGDRIDTIKVDGSDFSPKGGWDLSGPEPVDAETKRPVYVMVNDEVTQVTKVEARLTVLEDGRILGGYVPTEVRRLISE